MVARLAERIQHDSSNVALWLTLVQSYVVLGDRDKAKAAAADARRALADDPEKLRQIEELVKKLGIED
jgi:cytochrome c-type biogenesis protein CcmH